jgi:hypothetical protein
LKKTDFEPKSFRRDKESHCILIKVTIYQQHVTILNIYTLNIGVLTTTTREKGMGPNTVIVVLSSIDRPFRENNNKETPEFNR